ncbi:MAG: hypothetical protein IJO88_01155 [Oscillospiraceae bacterium]|nr:hypothetical protein [Oscillospiraceae bacterium]
MMDKTGKTILIVGAAVLGVILFLGESKMPPVLCGILLLCESVLLACLLLLPVIRRVRRPAKTGGAKRKGKLRPGRKPVSPGAQKLYLRYILVGKDRYLQPHEKENIVPFEAGKNIAISFKDHEFVVHCEERDGIRRFVIPAVDENGTPDRAVLTNGQMLTIRNKNNDDHLSLTAILGM